MMYILVNFVYNRHIYYRTGLNEIKCIKSRIKHQNNRIELQNSHRKCGTFDS